SDLRRPSRLYDSSFFDHTPTPALSPLSLHDALPILHALGLMALELLFQLLLRALALREHDEPRRVAIDAVDDECAAATPQSNTRSEEHTSELPVTSLSRMPSSA